MRSPILLFLFIVSAVLVLGKESTTLYQASGGELIDLIRGKAPENGTLTLTKVEGNTGSLPDGIYFKPEDELEDPGPVLYIKNATKNVEDTEKRVSAKEDGE